jgi:hypothetical protein
VGRTVRAPGVDGPRVIEIYLISKVISNVFSRKIASGRTVRGSMADSPLLTSKLERTVCSSGGSRGQSAACLRTGGQSAGSWRTVRPAQRAPLPAVDFTFLPLEEFKCGQSVRASRTVREVRVFDITASNGKGSINTPGPGWDTSRKPHIHDHFPMTIYVLVIEV